MLAFTCVVSHQQCYVIAGEKAAIAFIKAFPVKGQCYTDMEVEKESHKTQPCLLVSESKAVKKCGVKLCPSLREELRGCRFCCLAPD